jgi:hypothetical protein
MMVLLLKLCWLMSGCSNLTLAAMWSDLCTVYLEWHAMCNAGLAKSVVTSHSVLLCGLLAPLGFLSHVITCFVYRRLTGSATSSGGLDGSAVSVASVASSAGAVPSTVVDAATSALEQKDGQHLTRASSDVAEVVSGESGNGSNPPGQTKPATVANSGQSPVDQTVHKSRRNQEEDGSWLTIMDPVYINRS